VQETFTRVAVDSNVGLIVLYSWTPILFLISLRSMLKYRRKPIALAFYSLALGVMMILPVPSAFWLNSYYLYLAGASLLLLGYQETTGETFKDRISKTASKVSVCFPIILGIAFATDFKGVSQIEAEKTRMSCSGSPHSLTLVAGRAETSRSPNGLDLSSYEDDEPGVVNIRYSDTFRDSHGHYIKGDRVAGFVEKWVAENGGSTRLRYRRFAPKAFQTPSAK